MAAQTYEQESFLLGIEELIHKRREALGITQAQLAERIGVARCSIANIEAGRQDFPVSRLPAVAAMLRIGLGDLPG